MRGRRHGRVEDHLDLAPAVPQVDEDDAAQVAASGSTSTAAGDDVVSSLPAAAMSSVTRSRPPANPTPGVEGQPSASARPSYLPPEASASCCPVAPPG